MKVFVIDTGICNGCYNCQISCKDEHVGNDWTPIAKPQPDVGQFWLKMNETVRGTVPKVKVAYRPHLCMHCDKATCMTACKVKGALYKREDGLVVIDSEKCTGCKACVDACPYGAIYFNEGLNLAQKCTGCAHLIDRGWKEPRCADACPTGAIKFGEESEFKAQIKKAEVMNSEYGTMPRVYYLNLPKKFIAGTVYDPIKKEIIKGASCTLVNVAVKSEKVTVKTDGFGDFWFEGLKDGKYNLTLEAEGFPTKKISAISTEKDVNLGDIPLT
jgi:tetrathionate reductase subunit B